jgi:hypothetical protein
MKTLEVGALSLALANSLRALAYSWFSDSSLTAANQISSELGLALKARDKIDLEYTQIWLLANILKKDLSWQTSSA